MRTADEWFEAYGASHKNPTNKAIHWVCVPIILFVTIGLFWSIPLPAAAAAWAPEALRPLVNFGTVAVAVAMAFYLSISWQIAAGMALVSAVTLWGNLQLAAWEADGGPALWLVSAVVFFLAWVGQFVGHKIEGQKPSFFEDLQFLLVGPAWLVHFVYKRLGIAY